MSSIGVVARLLLGALMVLGAASANAAEKRETKDLALKGDKVCTRCHDETEAYPVLSIGRTRHGTVADGRTPTCVSCHGESKTHIDKPEGVSVRPQPDRNFNKNSKTPIPERNAACLTCHQGGKRILWSGSTHEARDVACTSCHQMHTDHDKVRDKVEQPEVCFNCHKEQRAQISRPSRHPIKEGKVACSDCHNPHGSAGPKLMARDTVIDTCYTCHMEKRGPFLWNHEPVTEDCALCHNPHGSTIPGLLKQRPPFLCQQCHEVGSHRGNIPNVSGGAADSTNNGIGITLARGCLNCHTNIHGGSNPVNNAASRTMRR